MKNHIISAFSLLLCMIATLSFAACGDDTPEQPVITTVDNAASIEDDIKITVPLYSIEEEYRDDMDALCAAYGYSSAKLNKKKETVTITCNAFQHDLVMVKIGMRIISNINSFTGSENFPCLVSVDEIETDEFSAATLTVKAKEFDDSLPFAVAQQLLIYQNYKGNGEYPVTVTIKDESGKEIGVYTYPD